MANVDYGQAQIQVMKDAVAAGTLKLDPDAAVDVVRVLDQLIDEMRTQRRKIQSDAKNTGLAGFPSSQQLAVGFSGKAEQLVENIDQYIVGAIQLQESFLRAAGDLTAADQKSAEALAAAGTELPGGAA